MCAKCSGMGYLAFAAAVADRRYCDCQMGADLQRVDARIERRRLAAEQEQAQRDAQWGTVYPDRKSCAAGDVE